MIPLREIPGKMARTWAQPMSSATFQDGSAACRAADRGARRPQDAPGHDQADPGDAGRFELGVEPVPRDQDGENGRHRGQRELRDVAEIRGAALQRADHQRADASAIEDQHRCERRDVDRDLEEDALFANPQDLLEHEQVARARDGEELGEPLDQPQHERFEEIHVPPPPEDPIESAHAEVGAERDARSNQRAAGGNGAMW